MQTPDLPYCNIIAVKSQEVCKQLTDTLIKYEGLIDTTIAYADTNNPQQLAQAVIRLVHQNFDNEGHVIPQEQRKWHILVINVNSPYTRTLSIHLETSRKRQWVIILVDPVPEQMPEHIKKQVTKFIG